MHGDASQGRTEALVAGLADRYRIERELGVGGMAVVYLAHDLQRDRDVALKVLRSELGVLSGEQRFDREIRLAARLVHPNILPLLDSGATDGHLWYTMPFVEGESLRSRLDREKQLPLDEAVRLTNEIADALGHAHAQGILHRDIKPENILLAAGHALVADFGIARALGETSERITGTGLALGTPGYMSPEQSSGAHDLDARSDLYALASITYEMLAGEPPFTGPTAQAVIARRLSQPPPSLRICRPGVPDAVDVVLQRALALVPADRFATTAEFARALSAASGDTRAMTTGPRMRSRWPLLAGAAALVVAAFFVVRLGRQLPSASIAAGSDRGGAIRLAVLPFRLISPDTADRYLAAGMTEEVSSALANLGGLRVIDQASVAPYAGGTTPARTLRTALSVDAVIDGVLQKVGDSIRVRVRLIDPTTEDRPWDRTWDHAAKDVFQVQSEVATNVAGVLKIQLAERESRSLARPPTTNPAAYDAYLRARARRRDTGAANAGRPSQADSVITDLRRAVQLDSTFAQAWGLLASELVSSVFLFNAEPARRLDEADRAIRTALNLDSTVAVAWKASHDLKWNAVRGWHFGEALADVRHALNLQPSLVAAHNALGSLYFHYGFSQEARAELAASLSLDPRDGCDDLTTCMGFSKPRVARVLWYEQKFDSALAIQESISFLGGFVWEKAVVLNALERPADGLAVLDSARAASGRENDDGAAARALLYAALGREQEALASIKVATTSSGSRSHFHHAQFTISCAYARLGRKAEAVEWLRAAAENGMPNYPLFRNDPNLRGLQGDPEYERFMAALERQFIAYRKLVHPAGN